MSYDKELGKASIAAVNQYLQLANELNLNIKSILNNAGICEEKIKDNSQHIAGVQFQRLIELLVIESKDELFGLHTAKFVQPGSYSVLGYISMNCDTLGQVISKIQPFEKLVGDMGKTKITQLDDFLKVSWYCQFPNMAVRRHMVDNCLASWVNFAKYLIDYKKSPDRILLMRPEPDLEQRTQYQQIFSCPVLYNQSENAILFDSEFLTLPLNKGDQQLLSTLESHAQSLIESLSAEVSLIEQVAQHIKNSLKNGEFRQQDVAGNLGISSKTLQRKLAKENYTFQQILDDTRFEQAKILLSQTSKNIEQVSQELGFLEPRSFYRWFNKLSGYTPGQYRELQ